MTTVRPDILDNRLVVYLEHLPNNLFVRGFCDENSIDSYFTSLATNLDNRLKGTGGTFPSSVESYFFTQIPFKFGLHNRNRVINKMKEAHMRIKQLCNRKRTSMLPNPFAKRQRR